MLTLLLACAIGDRSLTVNTIELNHVYDKRCELIYTQVIIWDIDASDGRTIYAVHFRETWTHHDRERQDSQAFWEGEAPNLFEGKK